MLNLSKKEYDRLPDEDKRKWEKAEDKYEAKRKQIIEKYSKNKAKSIYPNVIAYLTKM